MVAAYNRGGIEELVNTPRHPPGRKRRVSVQEYNGKIFPLVQNKENLGIPWTVVGVQKELAAGYNIHVSVSTLRRYLTGSGFRPSLRKPKLQEDAQWSLPWPEEYCRSLADYLAKTRQTI